LKERFVNQSVITTKEITDALTDSFPELSSSTISWKLNQLKKAKLIHQTGRGSYSFEFKPEYSPDLCLKTKRLYNRVKPYCKGELSVWDTNLLNEIADSNINKYWVFMSAPKEELESLFEDMKDFSKKVYYQPDKEMINRYILAQDEAIILTPLISETPLVKNGDYQTLSIEGVLVNIWMKYENFLNPIGYNLSQIFKKAFTKYNVNQSKLLRYAGRRDKRKEINELINKIS
jgi:L-rhamnose mutarotase